MTDQLMMRCRLCGASDLKLKKKSDLSKALTCSDFAITDSSYGHTLDIYSCDSCGLLQCPSSDGVLDYYVGLEDQEYEETRGERALQAVKILDFIKKYKAAGSLFDVGAGSGILVEQALTKGYQAEGVEPSKWLQEKAQEKSLPVSQGVLQKELIDKKYDIISIIDVVEHVEDPKTLLEDARAIVKEDGIVVITTPDVDSFFAKLLKWKWWHYRIAHISYFNKQTIINLIEKSGLEVVAVKRPSWYFTLFYLLERVETYLPKFLRMPMPQWLKRITIPLNLYDSLLIICKPKKI